MQGKKILIIDDDSRNIFALSATLRAEGFETLTATSVDEGLANMKNESGIALVLLDMMLPDIDGYEALRIIRNDKAYASMPVLAVTAQAMAGDKEKCIEAGADGYISKPIDVELLLREINALVN
jgi:CheY-like chemotaxis protein